MSLLGVNIDHVATVRQARREGFPDPVELALEAVLRILQGRHEEAVSTLGEGIYAWQVAGREPFFDLSIPLDWLETDAWFDPLRDRSDFRAVLDGYRAYLQPMRERVLEARETGDWESIRRRTYELAGLPVGDAARSPVRDN